MYPAAGDWIVVYVPAFDHENAVPSFQHRRAPAFRAWFQLKSRQPSKPWEMTYPWKWTAEMPELLQAQDDQVTIRSFGLVVDSFQWIVRRADDWREIFFVASLRCQVIKDSTVQEACAKLVTKIGEVVPVALPLQRLIASYVALNDLAL